MNLFESSPQLFENSSPIGRVINLERCDQEKSNRTDESLGIRGAVSDVEVSDLKYFSVFY